MNVTAKSSAVQTVYILEFNTQAEYDKIISSFEQFLDQSAEDDAFANSVRYLVNVIKARITDAYANQDHALSCVFFEREVSQMLLSHVSNMMMIATGDVEKEG